MSTLTIRLPEDTAQRLKSMAQSRGLSMNKLVEQLSAHALAVWDTENHFHAMAATGNTATALSILDRLDAAAGVRSARNHFPGLVTGVTSDPVMSQVTLQCGPFRVVSLISTEAVRELGLEVGSNRKQLEQLFV